MQWHNQFWWALTFALLACPSRDEPAPEVVAPPPAPIEVPGPPLSVRLDEARGWLRKGEVDRARARLERLILEDPTDAGVWTTLAVARLAAQEFRPALEAAERSVTLDPRNVEGWVTGGAAMRALGDLDKAEKAMHEALKIDPKSQAARWNLAGIYGQRGDAAHEAEVLEALVNDHPDDHQARFAWAQNALRRGDKEGAEKIALAVIERVPTMMEPHRMLAAMAWDRGDFRQAFERAKIAVKLAPDDVAATKLLESAFYVLAAARLTCKLGPRPTEGYWDGRAMAPVLATLEREEGLAGAGVFSEIDERFAKQPDVQAKVARVVAQRCAK